MIVTSELTILCPAVLIGAFGSPEAALLHMGYSSELARRILRDANERDPMWSDERTGFRLAESFLTSAQGTHAEKAWTEPCDWNGIVLHREADGGVSLWSAYLGGAGTDRDGNESLARTLSNELRRTVLAFEWRETSSFIWDAECFVGGTLQ